MYNSEKAAKSIFLCLMSYDIKGLGEIPESVTPGIRDRIKHIGELVLDVGFEISLIQFNEI